MIYLTAENQSSILPGVPVVARPGSTAKMTYVVYEAAYAAQLHTSYGNPALDLLVPGQWRDFCLPKKGRVMNGYVECATCGRPVTDPHRAHIIASDVRFPDDARYFVNWRIVHKGACDSHDGPWFPVERYIGRMGLSRFNRELVFQGRLRGVSREEVDELRDLLSLFPDPDEHEYHEPRSTGLTGRFAILKRDGYRCQICGRSAGDRVTLEVDHIVPRALGGETIASNLWTLCFDCNRGKRTTEL